MRPFGWPFHRIEDRRLEQVAGVVGKGGLDPHRIHMGEPATGDIVSIRFRGPIAHPVLGRLAINIVHEALVTSIRVINLRYPPTDAGIDGLPSHEGIYRKLMLKALAGQAAAGVVHQSLDASIRISDGIGVAHGIGNKARGFLRARLNDAIDRFHRDHLSRMTIVVFGIGDRLPAPGGVSAALEVAIARVVFVADDSGAVRPARLGDLGLVGGIVAESGPRLCEPA